MLNKAPKLKSTIRAKAKGHINIGPASEAMVGDNLKRIIPVFAGSDTVLAHPQLLTSYTSDLFSCFQIELLTLLFLNSLAEEAKAKAFEERSATIRGHHVRAVSKVTSRLNEISRINVPLHIVAYRLPYIALELIQIKYCRLGFIKTKSSYMV